MQMDGIHFQVPETAPTTESEKVAVTRSESEESQQQLEQSSSIEQGIDTPESTSKEESKEVQVQVSCHAVMQLIASGQLFAGRYSLGNVFSTIQETAERAG